MNDSLEAAPALLERPMVPVSVADLEAEFRVVARAGTRRGIRLERLFWASLKKLAESRKATIGRLVEEVAASNAQTGNVTSAIRVACLRWLTDQNADLKRLASTQTVNAMLLACPSPAFALSSSKRIVAFNLAFRQLVRRQLPEGLREDGRQDLRLSLDLNVADIFVRLAAGGEAPVVTGLVLGAGDRRYRGQVNAVRAPVWEQELLLCYVFVA